MANKAKSVVLRISGFAGLLLAGSLLYADTSARTGTFAYQVAHRFFGIVLGVIGVYCIKHSRRHSAAEHAGTEHTQTSLATGHIRSNYTESLGHVLYLRTFADDILAGNIAFDSFMSVTQTEEEELADVLGQVGPVIAIGDPTESTPQLGANRMYVADDTWQAKVATLMESARLVVIRAGTSPGVWWEIELAKKTKAPDQVVILIPMHFDRGMFTSKVNQLFNAEVEIDSGDLRALQIAVLFRSFGSLIGIIYFKDEWQPVYEAFTAPPFLRRMYSRPNATLLHYALRPAFERLGIRWQRLSINYIEAAAYAVVFFFCVLACVAFLFDLAPG